MENVTNLASTAATTASKMIFGDKTTEHNETGGQEPISGAQGKGTVDEPYDQGNKANPTEVPVNYSSSNPTVTADEPSKSSYSHTTGSGTQDNPISISDDDTKPSAASHSLPFSDKKSVFTGDTDTSSGKTPLSTDTDTSSNKTPFSGDKDTSSSDKTPFSGDKDSSISDKSPFSDTKDTSSSGKNTSLVTDDKPTYSSDHPTTSNDGPTPPRTTKTTENLTAGGLPGTGNDSGMPSVVNKLPTNATGGGMTNPADAAGQSGAAPPGPTSSDTNAARDHEGAEKPTDAPNNQQENAIKESTLSAEELMKKRDPNDHSGEPMHMHDGGDKGIAGEDKDDTSSKEPTPGMSSIPATQEERRDSKIGMPGGQEHGKEYGTGDRWEKTSGMAAEGGDFDATKPGAGREADRLMAQKGIQKTAPGEHPTPSGPDHNDTKEKVPLAQKIKDKLHIGSHK